MRLVFSRRAEADLRAIAAWFGEVAPEATARVLDDIDRTIDLLVDFPHVGAPIAAPRSEGS